MEVAHRSARGDRQHRADGIVEHPRVQPRPRQRVRRCAELTRRSGQLENAVAVGGSSLVGDLADGHTDGSILVCAHVRNLNS